MTKVFCRRARIGFWFRCCLAVLPLLAASCQDSKPPSSPSSSPTVGRLVTKPRDIHASPPRVTVRISDIRIHWGDTQQLFTLTLTNTGKTPETVHAIVYATNEQTQPPRRAISPQTAYQWFELAHSTDGRLTARDIQKNWHTNVFVSGRGGKLPFSWQAILKPGESQSIEAAHNLDERSPHPASKGKKLARVGFREYEVWLFTPDGQCFSEQTLPAQPPPPISPKQEEEAAKALRLARYYLDNRKPAQARAKLQLVLSQYPNTAAATEAKKLLAKIPE